MSGSGSNGPLGGVAIIGMSCRVPKARTVEQFWQRLHDGVECISFFTEEELLAAGVERSALNNPRYVKARGLIEDVDLFDAAFFNIPPKEAMVIDPQQRIFLECAWEALEAAGYSSDHYQGLIAVFAGAGPNYYVSNVQSNLESVESLGWYKLAIGNEKDHLAMRVSYMLDLHGPSLNVQTACSTSLVAIHLACQGLLDYQCDMALAGGVTINAQAKGGYVYNEGLSSPDGHCRAFDIRGKGFVSGNGVGVVVLKRLEEAIEDGDMIYAVIKGSAINNDGHSKAGYTAPSVEGQARAIAMALAAAELEPEDIGYVEAHGTATPLGDTIEIAALTQVFRASTNKKNFCAIGSLKTNVGHLDTAAGVAGVIKTALALTHKQIPPSLNFEEPNPHLDLANSPFYVNSELSEWRSNGSPRRAGVSSFGLGGTNAHVILEEPPAPKPSSPSRPWQLLMLAAKTDTALERMSLNLAEHLRRYPEMSLADVAFTLQLGRKIFPHRRVVLCRETSDAVAALDGHDPQRVFTSKNGAINRGVTFMFPGQGTQHVEMGLGLYRTEPLFRKHVDACCELLKPELGFDLREALYPSAGQREEAATRLSEIDLTQPALFVVEYALAQLWMEWGVRPRAMIGYSTGEYVAACLSKVLSLEDALSLVAFRGKLMSSLPRGAMLSVALAEDEVRATLGSGRLSIAAVNGPSACVVSGPPEAVDELEERLTTQGRNCRRLRADHAYHSSMIEPITEPLIERLKRVKLGEPQIRFVSNLTGTWITAGQATDPLYWAQHMRHTVRFYDGARELLRDSDAVLLEVGPGQMLSGMLRRIAGDHWTVNSLPHPEEQGSENETLATAIGKLWLAGVHIDWHRFYERESRRRVKLPTYPFERQRYWLDINKDASAGRRPKSHLKRRADVGEWFYLPVWKRTIAPRTTNGAEEIDPAKCWLVFEDSCGVGRKIVERLRAAGHDVVTVVAGEGFSRLDKTSYRIDPRNQSDYVKLLADVRMRGVTPERVAHFWSLTNEERPTVGSELFRRMQITGFYSLLFLAQALIKEGLVPQVSSPAQPPSLQLQVISNNVHCVTGDEVLWPEKATILGPCKSIPQEYPGMSCLSIDITLPEAGAWKESRLLDNLLADLKAGPSNSVLAYRGAERWVQTFESVQLEAVTGRPARLRERGVYLLTGGLGKDSLMRAEYLARELAARLVLVGRTSLPERSEWEHWLETHDEQDEISIKIRKIRGLLSLGAEVLIYSADVADEMRMRALIREIDERFGALHGVIHAAGLTDASASRLVMELSSVECEWQFQSKVYGLYVLDDILRGRELDFCILTSSVASIIGGVGLLAYTSANIFMDAFAYHHNQTEPVPWLSLNWQGATPEQTVDALKRILSMPPTSQLVVSIQDLEARINRRIKLNFLREMERHDVETVVASGQSRPNLQQAYVPPRTETEQKITDIWRDLLGVDWIGIHDSFLEIGGDSLLAVQFVSRLYQTSGVRIPIRSLFKTPTIAGLAESVEQLLHTAETGEQPVPGATPKVANGQPPARGTHGALAEAVAVGLSRDDAAAFSLVGLQTRGSRPPFFCVHPSGGNVFCFIHLARRLGNDQPFYALQAKGLNVSDSPHTRVEEMASFYLEALRAVRSAGPYLLGGWSMGGVVAFEMAQQLRDRGEEVGLLALLDTQAVNNRRPAEVEEMSHLINFANELALSWGIEVTWNDLGLKRDDLSLQKPDEQLDRLWNMAKEAGVIPPDAELFEGRHLLKVFRANAEALINYVPRAYPGRLTLIRTNDHVREIAQDPTLGWGQLVKGGIDLYTIDASHYTIVREPFVEEVARILAACLERARNR